MPNFNKMEDSRADEETLLPDVVTLAKITRVRKSIIGSDACLQGC